MKAKVDISAAEALVTVPFRSSVIAFVKPPSVVYLPSEYTVIVLVSEALIPVVLRTHVTTAVCPVGTCSGKEVPAIVKSLPDVTIS
jgi:hypothetical protein